MILNYDRVISWGRPRLMRERLNVHLRTNIIVPIRNNLGAQGHRAWRFFEGSFQQNFK
jgi:hypothetical protein